MRAVGPIPSVVTMSTDHSDTTARSTPASPASRIDKPNLPALSIVTPTFNEAENIPELIRRIHAALPEVSHEIIVSDDDSPDRTWEVAERVAETDPTVRVLRRFHDPGLSNAVLDGMATSRGDVLAVIDSDLQHRPDHSSNDVPEGLGRRTRCRGRIPGHRGWRLWRLVLASPVRSWVATLIARLLLRVPVSDPMSGYFMVSRDAYERTAPTINPKGFKILLEFIGRKNDLRVGEIGYEFSSRVHGETKLNRSVIRSYLLGVAELRIGHQVNPAFLLYVLVGIVGLAVNSVVFTLMEALNFPEITTGLNKAIDPVSGSFLVSVNVSILVLFALNNEFTFWEHRYRGAGLLSAFGIYWVMSLVGTGIHVAVFTSLQNIGFLLHVLGEGPSRVVQNLIGAMVALVVNWYLNTTYLWRRRQLR